MAFNLCLYANIISLTCQSLHYLCLKFFAKFWIIVKYFLHSVASLTKFRIFVREP